MRACHYCGKENEDTMMFCAECGTPLKSLEVTHAEPRRSTSLPPKKPPRVLNAGSATVLMLANLAVQVFLGVFMGMLASVIAEAQGIHNLEKIVGVLDKLMPAMAVLIPVLGCIVTVLISFVLIPKHLKDTSPNGAAWVAGPWLAIAEGLVIGLIVSVCFSALNRALRYHVVYSDLGPLDRMALTPGLPQIIWVVAGVLLAPAAEELLFRGVLYGGYRKSFGSIWAVVLTTLLFLLLHLPQLIHFPPAIAGLTGLALAALWCRLRSKAIGSAIAVHIGYNALFAFRWLTNH